MCERDGSPIPFFAVGDFFKSLVQRVQTQRLDLIDAKVNVGWLWNL